MELLSKNNSDCLKGIFSVAVLLCHLCGRTGIGSAIGFGPIYTALGYWAVSVFFLISGYGLAYSFEVKSGYCKTFIITKVFYLYLLQVLFILLYYLLRSVLLIQPTGTSVLNSFLFGETIISNGWYLQVIILFYILFYLIWFLKSITLRICLLFIFILSYIIICNSLELSSTWYETALCFPIGVYVYNNRMKICQTYMNATKWVILFLLAIIFSILFLLSLLVSGQGYIILKIGSSVAFALFVVYSSNIFNYQNFITHWLSKYYLGIYLFQGCAFLLLRNNLWYIDNHYLFFLIGTCATLTLSYCFQPAFEKLIKVLINKLVKAQ